MRLLALLSALLLSSACPGSTVMDASRYDQSCAQDADCAVVYEGDVCAPCGCPNAAINAGSLAAWNAEASRARQWCGPVPAVACGPCPTRVARCVSQACTTALSP
ncbi:MAG: hypothetical protein AB1730_00820 [Myxococcota bacterium]|jgi:hypothetical protein